MSGSGQIFPKLASADGVYPISVNPGGRAKTCQKRKSPFHSIVASLSEQKGFLGSPFRIVPEDPSKR